MTNLIVILLFGAILVLAGLFSSVLVVKLLKREADVQEVDCGKLHPNRALGPDEEKKYSRFYRKRLKTEFPLAVYELTGPYDYRLSENRGIPEFSLKVSGIRIHAGCIKGMIGAGVPLFKDFKNYQDYIKTDLYFYHETLVNDKALDERTIEDIVSKTAALEDKYQSLIPKIEVCFPNGLGKPAFIVRYGDWNMDNEDECRVF